MGVGVGCKHDPGLVFVCVRARVRVCVCVRARVSVRVGVCGERGDLSV